MSETLDTLNAILSEADCLADRNTVEKALDTMATGITHALHDKNPLVFAVLNGGIVLAGSLLPRLNFPLELAYLHATRYGNATRGHQLTWRAPPTHSPAQRHVLVLDDILDEGHTLAAIVEELRSQGAVSVSTAVLVHKCHDRKAYPGMRADFTGLDIEDRFLFGYGMDYKGYWRNAPGIFAVKGH